MESSMRILRPLNLNRNFSPKFFPKSHSLTLRFHSHPRINPQNLSPISQYDAVFRSPTFPNFPSFRRLGLLLSLSSSSSSNSPIHGVNSFNSVNFEASDSAVFHWHRAADPVAGAGAGYCGGGEREVAAVVLGWLGARPKHLKRYAEMYTSRGIDAVTFGVPVKDVLWFDLGRKVENRIRELADELVSWLSKGEGRKRCLIFHTFSNTGWLVYGAVLGHLQERPDLIERIGGCIVDSGGDPELNPKVWAAGFTAALVKKRNTTVYPLTKATKLNGDTQSSKVQDQDLLEAALLLVLEKIFSFLLKLPDVNQRLSKIISLLSENQPHCPQLYLYSTADKVIPYHAVESFIRQQEMKGRTVLSFNFGSSPHVDHYRTFPDVYTAQVNTFLNEILAMSK